MSRNAQIIRQWRLLQALDHRQWFTVNQLHDCLPRPRPHRRTVLRDLEGLSEAFPIEWRGRRGDPPGFEFRLRRPLTSLLKK
jgi:hypothetical protein